MLPKSHLLLLFSTFIPPAFAMPESGSLGGSIQALDRTESSLSLLMSLAKGYINFVDLLRELFLVSLICAIYLAST